MRRLFELHDSKYGSPRITADLSDAGWRVSENTVAALMRELALAARPKHRRKSTTRPGRGRWRASDLVKRDFPAAQLNRKWYGDGTEIATDEGKLHLASVFDIGSRRIPRHAFWSSPTAARSTRLGLTLPTVSGVLADLDRAGLVERRADPADRRRTIVQIIPGHAALICDWLDGAARPLARVLDQLTPADQAAFPQGHGPARNRAAPARQPRLSCR